jgi:hypothetical protein
MAEKKTRKTAKPKAAKTTTRKPRAINMKTGTELTKEFKGKNIKVLVTEDGFKYGGKTYKSITAVAKEITGYTISGPVFFGLAKSKEKAA